MSIENRLEKTKIKNIYQMKEIIQIPNFIHGFSTTEFGNMSFPWGSQKEVLNNRINFLSTLNIDIHNCVSMKAEHSNNIHIVSREDCGKMMLNNDESIISDGLITKEQGIFLFFPQGDCLPCIIIDTNKKITTFLHLSWKSTEAKICIKGINTLLSDFNCNLKDLFVFIGPGIHKESFKFENPIQKQLDGWNPFLKDLPDGLTSIDLIGYTQKQCEDMGILRNQIFISEIDTAKDLRFFSHFRDSKNNTEGRFACVAGFKLNDK